MNPFGSSPQRPPGKVRQLVFINSTGNVSGAEVVLCGLVELARREGFDVTVACPPGPLVERLPPGVAHLELPPLGLDGRASRVGRALASVRLGARYLRAARALAPTVRASATRTVVNSLLALPAARLARPAAGIRWLVHDTVHQRKQRLIVRASGSQVRRAVAVSEATAIPLRALHLNVTVAHNGVRWPVPPADPALHEPPVVGVLALLTPWKGHQVLLEALAQVPGIELELAGGSFPNDADYVAALHRRAEQADLRGRVRFLGHVDPLSTMRGWDVSVSPSTSPEAGPISVLEAMSLGVPVVGTAHGGTSEFLAGGAGLLVEPGDVEALVVALRRALTDTEFRHRSFEAGRRSIAEHHDLARTLPTMLAALLAP
ncbi:MAG: glycosyltransferase family 4 protein [Mycobacteriaceae bacterium]